MLEITGEYYSVYENFNEIDERINFLDEAKNFLQNSYFTSALRDVMPLAMATILNVNIIIFIKNSHSPMYITSLADYSEKTLFLVNDPEAPGHYDAALPYSYHSHKVKSVVSPTSCSCGINILHHHVHFKV